MSTTKADTSNYIKRGDILTCYDYAEALADVGAFDNYIDESGWGDNFYTERCFDIMMASAEADGIILSDKDDFDFDTFFYDLYQAGR